MDPQTAKTAIELQLADIADLLDSLYDNEESAQGDERAGVQTIQRDLQQQLSLLEGQVSVINILKDEYKERMAFKKLLDDEKQAVSDHQLAMRLGGMSIGAADAAFSADYEAQLNHGTNVVAEEQKTQAVLGSKDPIQCNACMEVFPTKTTLLLQCDHTYCRSCLLDLFTSSISNPTLFLPRCCRLIIPLDLCRVMLPKELTPNPTYCANADCSKFIRQKNVRNDVGHCVFCKSTTCVLCKSQNHTGLCPSDPHVQLLMDAAKCSKWQQCTKCNNMVELAQGCFHMT
jgi:E3 ubiquitin-protein ligase RNF144